MSTKCDQCRAMYGERTPPGEPPCDTCWVDLMPANKEAAEIYFATRDQILTAGMGQIIGVNMLAVFGAMDRYPGGIEDQWKCMNKVKAAFNHFKPEGES